MVAIQRRIVASGHGDFSGRNPIYFAVHSTANPGATAKNHVNYWSNEPKYAVHLVSDWQEAYQCVELNRICYQVGNGNPYCIGLEICEATNKANFLKGLEVARSVILQMLDKYGWTVDNNVRSHKWFTANYGGSDHTDPDPYFNQWGWTWNDFIQYLKEGDDEVTPQDITSIVNGVWDRKMKGGETAQTYLENSNIFSYDAREQLTRTDDPTGRGKNMNLYEHVKWIAKKQDDLDQKLDAILAKLNK